MARLTAHDFPQELLELYDYYAHGRISKREFISMAGKLAIGGMTGATLLSLMSPDYALAQQVEFTDPAIKPEYIHYPSPQGHGEVRGYLVRPTQMQGKTSAVVVVHENRGLNPYIEDVARRVAKAGYIALAPDGLSSLGGYPGNDDEGRAMQAKVDPVRLMNDFFAAVDFLKTHPESSGKVGITGFCYGGGVSNAAAVAFPELACAVPFYGRQPKAEDVARIKAPLLLHYAELDTNINAGWPAFEAALKEQQKVYQAWIYPGVNHGFHNDSTPRYDRAAAELAWGRTLEWFKRYLS
ncbi:dienelactone hydrolase family protein [Candidatus Pantoea deserta]|uniref:Dienelactone hydrolase family protein n=1 Tax=Candidatus Pantoea deserta TaxID=1869313 RepID=A0A3N4P6I6_9GAMM|nr:YghX family hydrolase [Pantoea deserta]RPD99299.1 dienelactone hydrolase family protein [Pantoea deserta]